MKTETRPSWLLKPITDYTELPLEQIAWNLGNLNRYGGAVRWTVLQHSLLVYELLGETTEDSTRLWGLLHDVNEAWYGDPTLLLKQACPEIDGVEHLCSIHIQQNLRIPRIDFLAVQRADKLASQLEMQHLDKFGRIVTFCQPLLLAGFAASNNEERWLYLVKSLSRKVRGL